MTYTLRIATQETRDLVVAALRTGADQRTRVAKGAARQVAEAKRGGADVRSRAVKVTALLAEADELTTLAAELEQATDVPVLTYPGGPITVTRTELGIVGGTPVNLDETVAPGVVELRDDAGTVLAAVAIPGDDGTSPAAQAIAELAGLTPSDPDAVEDPLTGALPEDAPTTVEEVLTP